MKKRLLSLLLCAMCVLAVHSEVTYILNEGFESGIPATWTQQVMSQNTQNWVAENSDLTNPNGAFEGTGRVALRNTTGTTQGYVTRLVTPVLNLPVGSLYELKFAYATPALAGDVDSLTVYYSTDGGAHWLKHTGFGAVQNSWKEVSLDLIGNGATYQLAFEAFDKVGGGIVLDAVRVFAKSECANVENFAADAHAISVDLSWAGDFGATFQLIVDTVSHALADLDPAGLYLHYEATTNDMVNVSGLLPEHTYYAYVRSICDDNESGYTEWQTVDFRTAIGFPYQADLTDMPAGWQNLYGALDAQPQPNTTNYKWKQVSNANFGAHVYGVSQYSSSTGYSPAWFVSPVVDFSTLEAGSPVELTFDLSISSRDTSMVNISSSYRSTSNLYVMASIDGGESWSQRRVCPGTQYMSAWRTVRVNLNEYVGVASSVMVALVAEAQSYSSVYFHVNNIKIDTYDAECGDVQSVTATNVTTNSAKIAWTVFGTDDVVVELSKSATFATLLSSDTLNLPSHEMLLSSLSSSTGYYVRVKQLCDDAEWAVCSFATLFGLPLVDNFNSISSGIPAGWDNSEGTTTRSDYRWTSYSVGKSGRGLRFDSYYNGTGLTNYLKTPNVLIGDEQVKLAFDYKNATGGEVLLQYSLDGGNTKLLLDTLGKTSDWKHFEYILADTLRNKSLMIIFFATSNCGYGDAYANLDNFELRPYDPNCLGLTSLKAAAEINDAVLSWTIGGSTHEALVHVSTQADFSDTVVVSAVHGVDTLLVEGLDGNTQYYARAIQNCGGFIWADALSVSFKTHCEPDTIPYIMDFEAETANEDPNCWTIVRASGVYPTINSGSTYPHNGTKSLYYGDKSIQNKSIAALPAFDQPISGLEMSFWLRAFNTSCTNTLEVGVMTNPLDTNTFVRIASFQPKSETYEQQVVGFNAYHGNGRYIAFRNAATGSYGFVIDDVNVHALPGCFRVGEIEVTEVTGQGASLYFAPTNADNYQVVVATEAINIDSLETAAVQAKVVYNQVVVGSTGEIVLDSASIFLGNTTYYLYMRGVCSESESGEWGSPVVFTTNCRPVTPAEFGTENFNSTANIACWKFGFTTEGSSAYSAKAQRTANLSKFGNVIQLTKEAVNSTSTTYNDGAYVVSPEFAVGDSINKFQITFSAATNNNSTTNVHKLVVAIVSSQNALSSKQDIQTITLPYATDSMQMNEYSVSFDNYYGDYMGRKGRYVMFQSVAGEDSTNYVVIDNIRLEPISNCKRVNEASVSNVTASSALYKWENVGAAQYEVVLDTVLTKKVDSIAAPLFHTTVSADSVEITGLNASTLYYAYVRALCGEGDTSAWSGYTAFKTAFGVPFLETFDSYSTYDVSTWKLYAASVPTDTTEFSLEGVALNTSSSYKMSFQSVPSNITGMSGMAARTECYSATYNGMLLSPAIDMTSLEAGSGLRLSLKLANVPYSGSSTIGDCSGRELRLFVSEDGGNTFSWDNVVEWNCTGTGDFNYNDFKSEAKTYSIDMSAYAGKNIALLIASTSSVSTPDAYLYIDSIAIEQYDNSCIGVSKIKSELTDGVITISWQKTDAADAYYEVSLDPEFGTLLLSDTISANSFEFNDWKYSTTYYVRVMTVCGSEWLTYTLKTPLGIPFVEDYQASTSFPAGWTRYSGDIYNAPVTSTTSGWTVTSSAGAGMAANHVYSYTYYSTYSDVGYHYAMVSPEFVLNNKAGNDIIFTYKMALTSGSSSTSAPTATASAGRHFSVALIVDSALVPLKVWSEDSLATEGTYASIPAEVTEVEMNLTAYAGKTIQLVFFNSCGTSTSSSYTYISLDDIRVESINLNCLAPELAVEDEQLHSVAFSWNGDSTMSYVVELAKAETFATVLASDTVHQATTHIFSDLGASTDYYVRVKVLCGDGVESAWSQALQLTTLCDVLALPWSENFNTLSAGIPNCWDNSEGTTTSTAYKWSYNASGVTGACLRFNSYTNSTGNTNVLATPELAITKAATLRFAAKNPAGGAFSVKIGRKGETQRETLVASINGSAWQTYEVNLSPYKGDTVTIYFCSTSNYGSGDAYHYLDNVEIELIPETKTIMEVYAAHVERTDFGVAWTVRDEDVCKHFEVVVATSAQDSAALADAQKIVVEDTTIYEAHLMQRATTYYVYVRSVCGELTGEWMMTTLRTKSLDENITLGNGTSSASLVYTSWGNTISQMIFTADELQAAGLIAGPINSVSYNYNSTSSSLNKKQRIYLGTTTKSTYTGYSPSDFVTVDQTVVYGPEPRSYQSGWVTYTFDTPYVWDGVSNLVLTTETSQPDGMTQSSSTGWSTAGTTLTATRLTYRYVDNKPVTLDDLTAASSGGTSTIRPNVRFAQTMDACPAVETVSHELLGDGTSSARIAWTASTGDYTNSYSVLYADSVITDWTNVNPQIDSIQVLDTVISGLEAYTDYYVYVIAHCDAAGMNEGNSVWSEVHHFKTASTCPVVENLVFAATDKNRAMAAWTASYTDKNFVYVLSTDLLDEEALEAAQKVVVNDTTKVLFDSLAYDQTYYLYVAHNCGVEEGLSPFLMDSIHTSASCPAVENLRTVAITPYTITVAWDRAAFAEETEWEVGVVGRESVAQVVTAPTAVAIGLDPDMDYTVYVKALCSETEESALVTLPVHTHEASAGDITIADGTSTSSALPVYGYYLDDGIYTETMYLASLLDGLAGADITGVKYYPRTDASWGAQFNVYLQETDVNSEQTFVPDQDEWVLVYQGELTASVDNGMQIDFTAPYSYSGRNLVIIIQQTSAGTSQSVSFNGASQSYTCGYYEYYDMYEGDYVAYTSKFLPKTDFLVEASACPAVKKLSAKDITAYSANISWLPGAGEISWAVVFSDSVKTAAQLATAEADTLTYKLDTVFSGLNSDTEYHVYVRSLCSSAVSDWKHLSFTTQPTCIAPQKLDVKAVTDSTALLTWSNLTPDFTGSYVVAVGKAATFNLAVDSTYTLYSASDTAVLVNGLVGLTSYKFAVKELCSADDNSRWSATATFSTECSPYALPYVEDFENVQRSECWLLDDGVSFTNTSTYAQSGTYALRFNKENATLLAVLPTFTEDIAGKEFSYAWRCEGSSSSAMGYLEAGYVTDANDAQSFVQIQNHPQHVYEYMQVVLVFPDTVPAGARAAFRYSGQTSYWYLFVDDVRVRDVPLCAQPDITAEGDLNTITVHMSDTADFIVELARDAAFTRMVDSVFVQQTDSVVFESLMSGTIYYVRTQRVCEGDDKSDWSAVVSVTTVCVPISAFPWVEDFDAYTSGDYVHPCVNNIAYRAGTSGSGSTGKLFTIYTSTQNGNSTPMLQLPDQQAGTLTRLYLPEMVFDTTSLYEFSMDIYRASATTKTNEGIRLYLVDVEGVEHELTFISRDFATPGALVPAEAAAGWYTYTFALPNDGGIYRLMLQGESQYGLATYMDNFTVVAKNANCLGVENIVVSNVSLLGADLAFNYVDGAANAVVELADVADFSSVLVSDSIVNDSTYHFTGLVAGTTYYVRIKQICGEGEESAYAVAMFTTGNGVRYAPVFASTSASTTEWKSAASSPTAENAVDNGAPLTTLSGWSLTTTAIRDVHFKANVYGTSSKKWLVTPSIDLSPNVADGIVLSFNAALTKYAAATKPAGNMQDDRMVVLVCVDDSAWFKVAEWNNTGTGDYVYADIDSVATPYQLNLAEFGGQSNIRIAFYGESTESGDDNDLHIANIVVDRADAISYIGDICEGLDYDGATEGNPFYIHASECTIGENRFVKIVGDSTCILLLTVYPNETEEYSVTVCEGDSYQDEYFNLPNITLQTNTEQKNKNLTTEHGCIKTVIMHLTINPIQRTTEQRLLCTGDTLTWNGQTISEPGNYTFETKAATGCDSIVTLAVKWDVPTEEYRDTLLHAGETMTLNDGTVINKPGEYREVFEKESGCTHTVIWTVTYEETALEAILDEEGVTKMVIDNHVVIIRNGVIYSVEGTRLN